MFLHGSLGCGMNCRIHVMSVEERENPPTDTKLSTFGIQNTGGGLKQEICVIPQ